MKKAPAKKVVKKEKPIELMLMNGNDGPFCALATLPTIRIYSGRQYKTEVGALKALKREIDKLTGKTNTYEVID